MKLVIVDRSHAETYQRMQYLLAADPTISVIWDRRTPEDDRRRTAERRDLDRRSMERRQRSTEFGTRGFIIIDVKDAVA